VPVSDEFHDEQVGRVFTNFFDVVLGISDPNIFVPDHSCPKLDAPAPIARHHRRH
jgi:hypothetical protein